MNVLGSGSASSRRTIVAGFLAAVLGAAVTAQAQQAPAPAPAAPAQAEPAPAPDAFKFTSDAALVVWVVKGDKTADFEAAWGEVLRQARLPTFCVDEEPAVEASSSPSRSPRP